ncbi:MAG: riboflavin synthase subunit alpha [Aquabacterium sp.]
MFTGIVQGQARISHLEDLPGLRRLRLALPGRFGDGLAIGASVACDGTCLTVTALHAQDDGRIAEADFDVMQQTLSITTLGARVAGDALNVERAAPEGAEVGGHVLSGHVDGCGEVLLVREPDHNRVLRIGAPLPLRRYLFAKGYVAVNGASLTMAEVDRDAGWFEVWLIPETLRITSFGALLPGAAVNIEVERQTQVIVDTVHDVARAMLADALRGQLADVMRVEVQGQVRAALAGLPVAPPTVASGR